MSTQNVIPAIKLFGRKIPVPDIGFKIPTEYHVAQASGAISTKKTVQTEKSDVEKHLCAGKDQVGSQYGEDQTETNQNEQEKTFKKPEKILPCPRCNSFDTKFCYFNNYNVNQPRHFCKNCQRYWTAGGTMRNVPVGAGRRKHKQFPASQYRQAVFSVNGMAPSTHVLESPDSTNHHRLSSGELATPSTPAGIRESAVLKFGAEATLSESMDCGLNLRGLCGTAESRSGIISESREEPSFVTEVESTSSGSCDNNGNPPQQFPALFVPYQSGWQNLETPIRVFSNNFQGYDRNSVQWRPPQAVAIPSVCTQPTIPLQIIPSPYLGFVPLAVLNSCLSPCSPIGSNGTPSVRSSPTLGKHSREANSGDIEKSDNGVVVPKTLRIDDPNEASRSPIWATLSIKLNEKVSSSVLSGKAKCAGIESQDAANVKEANPVAFSRSESFREST